MLDYSPESPNTPNRTETVTGAEIKGGKNTVRHNKMADCISINVNKKLA